MIGVNYGASGNSGEDDTRDGDESDCNGESVKHGAMDSFIPISSLLPSILSRGFLGWKSPPAWVI